MLNITQRIQCVYILPIFASKNARSLRARARGKSARNMRCGVRFGIFRAYFDVLGSEGRFEQQFVVSRESYMNVIVKKLS
jgi:hypothetical protein